MIHTVFLEVISWPNWCTKKEDNEPTMIRNHVNDMVIYNNGVQISVLFLYWFGSENIVCSIK